MNSDSRDTIRQIAVWVAAVATIVVNGLSESIPINNQTSGEIANQFMGQNLWLPAGYVFSIWGLIYVLFIAYAIFQSLPSQRENPRLRAIGWPFVISCLANMAWLIAFHYDQFLLSMVVMIILLVVLIWIYLQLRAGAPKVSRGERWTVHLLFSVYLGWITVATIANAAHVLVSRGWTGQPLPAVLWLIIMYVAALLIAALIAFTKWDVAYLLVLVWAFAGIAVNYLSLPAVAASSIIAALIALALAVLVAARKAWQGKAYA
ncbi:MAG: TspO/MBR family protein [Nitrososphaerales archaeon]